MPSSKLTAMTEKSDLWMSTDVRSTVVYSKQKLAELFFNFKFSRTRVHQMCRTETPMIPQCVRCVTGEIRNKYILSDLEGRSFRHGLSLGVTLLPLEVRLTPGGTHQVMEQQTTTPVAMAMSSATMETHLINFQNMLKAKISLVHRVDGGTPRKSCLVLPLSCELPTLPPTQEVLYPFLQVCVSRTTKEPSSDPKESSRKPADRRLAENSPVQSQDLWLLYSQSAVVFHMGVRLQGKSCTEGGAWWGGLAKYELPDLKAEAKKRLARNLAPPASPASRGPLPQTELKATTCETRELHSDLTSRPDTRTAPQPHWTPQDVPLTTNQESIQPLTGGQSGCTAQQGGDRTLLMLTGTGNEGTGHY
ncbi:hypothetical protein Bbelb_244180 [Branchiostoma belcheri]|nr:hypothetical protein Bbelb_244180 [Branchiostoma belcheri]